MGTDFLPFGENFFHPLSVAVFDYAHRIVHPAEFAKLFETDIQPLIGHGWQGPVPLELLAGVFVKNCPGITVQVYREPVMGFLCGYIDIVMIDVGPAEFCHIGVPKGGECTETEQVPGPFQGGGILNAFDVAFPAHVGQPN